MLVRNTYFFDFFNTKQILKYLSKQKRLTSYKTYKPLILLVGDKEHQSNLELSNFERSFYI